MRVIIFCSIFTFLISLQLSQAETDRVICYYGSWSNYRNGNGKYTSEDIDPYLCTHVVYTFLGLGTDGNLKILDSWLELDLKNLQRFNSLKTKNPKLKTLIAVGGWNEGSVKYSQVASDSKKRATLVKSAVNFLETYGFDGFDIDWEYPGQRGGGSNDKENFSKLLKEFRKEFDKKGFILTAAVAAASNSVDLSYDVPALSKYLDSINVMAYDLHGAFDGVTGANAPLYPSSIDVTPAAKSLTVDAAIRGWLQRGADPQKISMGMPLYGRTFTVSSSSRAYGTPAAYGGTPGPYTQESGMLGYLEICEKQKEGGWKIKWDNNTKTPYMYKGNQWVSYDNAESIKLKVEYAKSMKLGGVMIWSLETADHKGICGDKYPILNLIKSTLNSGSGSDSDKDDTTKSPEHNSDSKETDSDSTESNPDSKESNPDSKESNPDSKESDPDSKESEPDSKGSDENDTSSLCKESSLVRDPEDCSGFYSCVPDGISYRAVRMSCPPNLAFDQNLQACNYKNLVDC